MNDFPPPTSRQLRIATAIVAIRTFLCRLLWRFPCWMATHLETWGRRSWRSIAQQRERRIQARVNQRTAELRESKERYRTILDHILDGLIIVDATDRIDALNLAAERIFGYRLEAVRGQPLSLLLVGTYPEFFAHLRQRRSRAGFSGELFGRRHGGSVFPVDITVGTLEVDGQPGFSLLVRDISERRRSEQAQERLVAILDNSPDVVMTFAMDGQLLFINRVGRRLYSLEHAPLAYRSVRDLIPAHKLDYLLNHAVPIAFLSGLWEGEGEMPGPAGEYRQAAWQLVRHQVGAGGDQYYSLSMRDITDHKRRERDLIAARHAAEAAVRAKSAFLAAMSHEIRTPMNGILGMAELLRESALIAEQREFVETLLQSGQALLTLLNDILDFSKIEAGKLRLDPVPFDLERLVQEVLQVLAPHALKKSLALIVDYAPECPHGFLGDAGRLRQVLLNLVGNAIKFTEQGHVRIWITGTRLAGQRVALCLGVEDTGVGIETEVQQRLFQAFMQADTSITRRHGGSGLGLAIARQLMALMGGEIRLRSQLGQGSCFDLTLILPTAHVPATVTAPNATLSGRYHGRVLLAEDVATNRTVANALLQHLGLVVETVENGQAALERCATEAYDLVFMDCQMPVLDGLAATRELRRLEIQHGRQRQPVIALTANAFPEDRQQCQLAGMDDFLAKPLQLAALETLLSRWLGVSEQATIPAEVSDMNCLLNRTRLEHLREIMGEDFLELMPVFQESVQSLLQTARQALLQADRIELRRCVHGIKSASANLGALLLSKLAQEAETAAEYLPAEEMTALLERLDLAFQQAQQILLESVQ